MNADHAGTSVARRWSRAPTLALPVVAVLASGIAWERMLAWLVIGASVYAWALFALLRMQLRWTEVARRPWQMSLRRLLLNISVLCCLLSVVTTDWPLRARFAFSRSSLDALADRVQRGDRLALPRTAGLFSIRAADSNREGQPCLWVRLAPGGNTGLVRCPPDKEPALNLAASLPLGEGWYLVSED